MLICEGLLILRFPSRAPKKGFYIERLWYGLREQQQGVLILFADHGAGSWPFPVRAVVIRPALVDDDLPAQACISAARSQRPSGLPHARNQRSPE